MKTKEASDLFYEINDWAEQTFGKDRDPKMILKHLEEELGELSNEVRRLRGGFTTDKMDFMKEYADMQILLWNLADTMGMCYNSCVDSVMIKHNINKARTYVEVDGKMKHVPDEVEVVEKNVIIILFTR
jgi:NTP pyrophosphatase (non-canonical NTP hydrolase)